MSGKGVWTCEHIDAAQLFTE